jgi:hypothetical protein
MIDDFNTHVNYAGLNADATQPDDGDDDSQLYKMDILNVNEVVCLTDTTDSYTTPKISIGCFWIPSFPPRWTSSTFSEEMSGSIFSIVGC